MGLLFDPNLHVEVNHRIRGSIARIGGCVNQLLTYQDCSVEDFNMGDGGYGRVRSGLRSVLSARRLLKQEIQFRKEGWKVPRDRKTIVMDVHNASRRKDLFGRYDATVSSNVIEHSPNPIWLLLNYHFITKPRGWQYHAIPHFSYTYDKFREPTPVEHMIGDFENFVNQTDKRHNADYVQSAIIKHGWQKQFHEKYPVAYPYIHFHVFNEINTKELFEFMFEEVRNDIIRTKEFGDNVVLCRNILRNDFAVRYGGLIKRYKYEFVFSGREPDKRCVL